MRSRHTSEAGDVVTSRRCASGVPWLTNLRRLSCDGHSGLGCLGMEPVVTSLAGKLASGVLGLAAPKIRDRLVGSDEERALDAVYRAAFEAMLAAIPGADDRARMDALEPQLLA